VTDPDNPGGEPEIEILSASPVKFDASGTAAEAPGGPEGEMAEAPSPDNEWKAKAEEAREKLLWVAAEFDNYKKRVLKDREEDRKFSQASLLKEFLGVGDNLERALAAMPAEGDAAPAGASQGLKQGVELTLRFFQSLLAKYGVTRMQVVGEKFDPRLHEVMFEEKTDRAPEDTVLEEFQAGYIQNDRVLRSAMVKVARNTKAN
jgi:molecular chaperone GrpE